MEAIGPYFSLLIPVVALIAVFTFVSVATWSENRRREREAYYRHETYRKLMEHSGDASRQILQLMRQEEIQQQRKRIEGLKLGGLITLAVGGGIMVFLRFFEPIEGVYLVGLIPLLIGLVLAIYGFLLAPRPTDPGSTELRAKPDR